MTDLKTLRDVSGLSPVPARLRSSALVMIDLQNTYREGIMRLEEVEPAIRAARELLDRAREAGIPIFHIQHDAGRREAGAVIGGFVRVSADESATWKPDHDR